LFAEDTPTPYNPSADGSQSGANTVWVAGAAYQIPAFWLYCFDKANLAVVVSEGDTIPALVSEMAPVSSRLAEREAVAKEVFPAYGRAWDEFRRAVEAADRKYLKLDACEIFMLYKGNEFGRLLEKALNWFGSRRETDLDALLSLAGIDHYNGRTKSFSAGEYDSEMYLYGWLGV